LTQYGLELQGKWNMDQATWIMEIWGN